MSTTIYDAMSFAVARCASQCARCHRRGRCVEFVIVCSDEGSGAHTYTLCLDCFDLLCVHIKSEEELRETVL